mgnify:CR=1 FL=1
MQLVDFTTLTAACHELSDRWLPARLEQVYQRDRYTVQLGLRTLEERGWLTLCWHPQAARLCMGDPPPRTPDTFTFSQQLRHQLNGLALVKLGAIADWERVVDLQFARRPGEPALWHLYVEIMGKYSNVVLVNAENVMITAAHQVSVQQSRLRPIQTGQPYTPPPPLTEAIPRQDEPQSQWQQRISLIPGALSKNLLTTYRGLSSPLANTLIQQAGLSAQASTDELTVEQWQSLYQVWQRWLEILQTGHFQPGWLARGYTVLGWNILQPAPDVQTLLDRYYTTQLNQQEFAQLQSQLGQRLKGLLTKLNSKAEGFRQRLNQSAQADLYRNQADLLMAHLQEWQPGLKSLTLADFNTGQPVTIALDPEKNAIQNAQSLYKRHQKLKRARTSVEPLLADVEAEIQYLEQVEAAVQQCDPDHSSTDLLTLMEIREELIQQHYLKEPEYRPPANFNTDFHHYKTPSGFELLIGRNNHQNDRLTFRLASPYDLWFHAQEIPGSHVLLRLAAGEIAQDRDLQCAADFAAYYSRARQSAQVPVVYTQPKNVYKPKGAKPGIAIYKREQQIWGQPHQVQSYF